MKKRILFATAILALVFLNCRQTSPPAPYQIQKRAIGQKAMVVSAHPLATKVGVEVLRKGGNAVEAAVAVQFALAVVYPRAGNIGGGGFMVIRANDGRKFTLDYRETAPVAASRDMYLDENGNVIKNLSLDGHLAAGVPGTVAGMEAAYERFGDSMTWKELVEPSVALAEDGFAITTFEAKMLNRKRPGLVKNNNHQPVFVKSTPWKEGDLLQQKDLANTLQLIADHGKAGFYSGEVADHIVAEMEAGNGIISHEDLKSYEAKWREPLEFDYKDYEIISMPPPSSGGIALGQLLQAVAPYPLREWGFHSPQSIHLMAEAERWVYADRSTHLGDSDYYPVPVDSLLSPDYILDRMSAFSLDSARASSEIQAAEFSDVESEETTHYSIVDAEGNAVSVTTTLNANYGSKTVVKGAGFLLNNEMDDFSAKPGEPNLFGLIGGEANSIQPGKRMLSSMTPAIVSKNDKLFMVVGTPGGSTIITSVFQTILNVIEFDMGMAEAVAAPRFHHQWLPDSLFYEDDRPLSSELRAKLKEMGHHPQIRDDIGKVDAILVREDGNLEGGADTRADDHAEGF